MGRAGVVGHVVNHAYDPARDAVMPQSGVTLALETTRFGIRGGSEALILAPGAAPRRTRLNADGRIRFDIVGPWTLVVFERSVARPIDSR